jgi:hypothetical protein
VKIDATGATENNLKDVDRQFSSGLTVFTGVSGSGKATFVFDTVYYEAQRGMLQSLSLSSQADASQTPPLLGYSLQIARSFQYRAAIHTVACCRRRSAVDGVELDQVGGPPGFTRQGSFGRFGDEELLPMQQIIRNLTEDQLKSLYELGRKRQYEGQSPEEIVQQLMAHSSEDASRNTILGDLRRLASSVSTFDDYTSAIEDFKSRMSA